MRTIEEQMSLLSKAHVCSGCTDQPTKNKINRLHKKAARDYAVGSVENLCWENILIFCY